VRVMPSADGSNGSAEAVAELGGTTRATSADPPSLCARWLSLSRAAFAGKP
jgi:hypothetical protein